jgi:glycerol dehydrogenase-like iron-containing ADH family enzyme
MNYALHKLEEAVGWLDDSSLSPRESLHRAAERLADIARNNDELPEPLRPAFREILECFRTVNVPTNQLEVSIRAMSDEEVVTTSQRIRELLADLHRLQVF